MKNKSAPVVLVYCITIMFGSCSKDDFCNCLEGTGATTLQVREADPFSGIQMENNVDVIFTQADEYSLSVTGGSNIINGITTEVEGSTLFIKNKNKCNWLRNFRNEFTVRVSGPDLYKISTSGSGNFTNTDTLRSSNIRIESRDGSGTIEIVANNNQIEAAIHTGPVDILISGKTTSFGGYSGGTGFIRATGLSSDYAWMSNSGTGDISLNVKNELSVNITHTGDIYYNGNPYSISTNITGSGKLIKSQ